MRWPSWMWTVVGLTLVLSPMAMSRHVAWAQKAHNQQEHQHASPHGGQMVTAGVPLRSAHQGPQGRTGLPLRRQPETCGPADPRGDIVSTPPREQKPYADPQSRREWRGVGLGDDHGRPA